MKPKPAAQHLVVKVRDGGRVGQGRKVGVRVGHDRLDVKSVPEHVLERPNVWSAIRMSFSPAAFTLRSVSLV